MKTIKAVKDKIAALVIRPEKVTKGGIVIPETVNKDPQGYGEVISVGEEVKTIKEKDVIMFHQHGGQDIILDGNIIKVLAYNEVYGTLKEEEE